jgi:hypothetical protein
MSLDPATLADRLDAATHLLSRVDATLAQACEEAAAFFREEFDVAPGASGEGVNWRSQGTVVHLPARDR